MRLLSRIARLGALAVAAAGLGRFSLHEEKKDRENDHREGGRGLPVVDHE